MYIVIDTFDQMYPSIVVDVETGMPLLFAKREDAEAEAEECQVALVVEI